MYVDHNIIKCDRSNDDTKVWKYLDLWKLLSIIENKALYFSRLDLLGDPFEGTLSARACSDYMHFMFSSEYPFIEKLPPDEKTKRIEQNIDCSRNSLNSNKLWRKTYCASCWHANPNESYAFWNIYASKNEGLAIQSNIRRIKDSLINTPENVFIGDIKYIDYSIDSTGTAGLEQFYKKNKEYEYENEVRLLTNIEVEIDPILGFTEMVDKDIDFQKGRFIKVDLEIMIENIYISPNFEDWKREILEKTLDRYELKIKPIKSKLSQPPFNPMSKT